MLQSTVKAQAKPKHRPKTSKWTCTLCSTTMTWKDITQHKQGKKHIAALAKIDETFRAKMESECFRAVACDPQDTSIMSGDVQAIPTAKSSIQYQTPRIEASALPGSTPVGTITSSKSAMKAQKNKGKTAARSKQVTKSINTPPISIEVNNGQLVGEYNGWFIDSFGSLDYSICDKDCGWCGTCMDTWSYESVLLSLFQYYSHIEMKQV